MRLLSCFFKRKKEVLLRSELCPSKSLFCALMVFKKKTAKFCSLSEVLSLLRVVEGLSVEMSMRAKPLRKL